MSSEELVARREERGQFLADALGALIKEEREARKWSGRELAKKLGMGQSAVAEWERGSRHRGALHIHNIEALEEVFEMQKGAIFYRLGLVAENVGFRTFVMGRTELNKSHKSVFMRLYGIFTSKDPAAEGVAEELTAG